GGGGWWRARRPREICRRRDPPGPAMGARNGRVAAAMGRRMNAIDATPLRACAGRAADVLVETAMVVGGTSTWLGVVAGRADEGDNAIYSTGQVTLYDGSAGIVLALLRVAQLTGAARWRTAARTHGEHLLAVANRHPWGWGWPLAAFDGRELCGLAHGAAGIAWAMGALAAATGDSHFLAAVDGARRYERSWFQRVENNWPDLRETTQTTPGAALTCPAYWCHGATGIGLSRLALFRLDPHLALIAEATSALQAATSAMSRELDGYPAAGLTLCHGLGGSLLLLAAAHHTLGEASHLEAARWLAAQALDRLGP